MYKKDLALNNLQWLIWHETKWNVGSWNLLNEDNTTLKQAKFVK